MPSRASLPLHHSWDYLAHARLSFDFPRGSLFKAILCVLSCHILDESRNPIYPIMGLRLRETGRRGLTVTDVWIKVVQLIPDRMPVFHDFGGQMGVTTNFGCSSISSDPLSGALESRSYPGIAPPSTALPYVTTGHLQRLEHRNHRHRTFPA